MKIEFIFITFLFYILPTTSMSQNIDSPLTLEDLIPGGKNYTKYRIQQPKQIQWWGDTPLYVKGDSILSIPRTTEKSSSLLVDRSAINDLLPQDSKIKSLGQIGFPFPDKKVVMLGNGLKTHILDLDSKYEIASYDLPKDASNHDFSAGGLSFAYTKNNNLYALNQTGEELTITSDENKDIVNGQSAHRNEFGIKKGTFWSPSGKNLAFYRMDESPVTDYPLVDVSQRVATLKNIKYPMAGMKSHQVTLGIYNFDTKKTTFLKTGTPKEKYLTNVVWSPDEKFVYLAEVNRGQDTCKIVRYDTHSGKLDKTLFVETHPKYVEPENPVLFVKNSPELFIWQSKRDGHNHLYLYNINGDLIKQLTSGDWDVIEVLAFDKSGDNLLISSTEVSPIERHIYKLNLKDLKRVRLTQEPGVHQGIVNASGNCLIDMYTSKDNPGKIDLVDTKSTKSSPFFSANSPYEDKILPEIILSSLKTDDGETDLFYRMVKPIDFDATKKYPVIIYVYGGPHSQLVDNSWLAQTRGWDIYMAQKGYIVFTLDNRGTINRGLDFENITHRRLGVVETQDQMTGVNYLKSLPYVDADRIGVHGWSYGGFMTLNLMLRHPDIFKVGVAGGPVTDWKYYEIMYGERYMDTPKENPSGYSETNMIDRAGDLKGRLILIHGDEDPTVVMQHSLEFLNSAIKEGTHPDFFVYPGHGHNMTGHARVHLHEHITRYFDDFLK